MPRVFYKCRWACSASQGVGPVAATQGKPVRAHAETHQPKEPAASRDGGFRPLWALIGRRAKRACTTPQDVER